MVNTDHFRSFTTTEELYHRHCRAAQCCAVVCAYLISDGMYSKGRACADVIRLITLFSTPLGNTVRCAAASYQIGTQGAA